MKKTIILFFIFTTIIFSQGWKNTIVTSLPSVSSTGSSIDKFSNNDGINVLIDIDYPEYNLKYYLLNTNGTIIRSYTIENQQVEFPNITGNNDNLYAVYKIGNYIRIKKSTNAGQNWNSAVGDITLNGYSCRNIDATYDNINNRLCFAFDRQDNGYDYETYYKALNPDGSWYEQKQVTDYGDEVGGFPTVSVSQNRVHISYNTHNGDNPYLSWGFPKSRDKYLLNWNNPQTVYPLAEVRREKIHAGSSKLFCFYFTLGGQFGSHLYVKTRSFENSTWSSAVLLKEDRDVASFISTTNTSDGKTHVIYNHGLYRSYSGSTWSPELALTEGYAFTSLISSVSNDLFVLWDDGQSIQYRQYDAAPLTPSGVSANYISANQAVATWNSNQEPDLAGYNIYRQFYYGQTVVSETKINSSLVTTTSFTDNFTVPGGVPPGVVLYLRYKVEAVDQSNNISGQGFGNSLGILPSSISGYTTISGQNICLSSSTVGQGATLNVSSGSVIRFYNGSKLYVSGTGNLQANGTAGSRIVFDFISRNSSTQNGIHLSAGSASIKYCDISNAYRGIYIIYANPITVQNCNILYNSFGIYQAYGNSSSSIIDQNNISYNYSDGIYIQESVPPQITKNIISSNGRHGIFSTSYTSLRVYNVNKIEYNYGDGIKCELSSLYLLPTSGPGNNIIRGNRGMANLHATSAGSIYANNSYSSIYWPEMLNAYAENSGHIYAENNWWGSVPPYGFATNGGTIDYIPYLYADPNAGLGKTSGDIKEIASKTIYPSDSFFDPELKNILSKMIEEKYEEAIPLYFKRLKVESNKEKKRYILNCLAECYLLLDKKDFKTLLDNDVRANLLKNDDLYASTLELENLFFVKYEEYDKAIGNLNLLKRDFSNNEDVDKHATFNLWSLYYQKINDKAKADIYYNELKEKYVDDDLTITAMLLTGEKEIAKQNPLKKELVIEIPKEFNLIGNYPNPFNPSTTFSYSLPYESSVELVIYDIMGREVKSFTIPSQSSGIQNILWDGKNENGMQAASGIYLYRITLKSLENNEMFVKTAKLMMLK